MSGSDSTRGRKAFGRRNREDVGAEGAQPKVDPWWNIRLFSGIANDIRRRAPYYGSDWKDAWDYRVVPATVYMYFAKYATLQENVAPYKRMLPLTRLTVSPLLSLC
jgi:hypothetical protein